MKTLTIKTSKWLHGGLTYKVKSVYDAQVQPPRTFQVRSCLLSSNRREKTAGKMCCLGFACVKAGAKKAQIRNVGLPMALDNSLLNSLPGFLQSGDFTSAASVTNDDPDLTMRERKAKLKALFATVGVKLKFIP